MMVRLQLNKSLPRIYKKCFYSSKRKLEVRPLSKDIIGPPNPISNIRPISIPVPIHETSREKELRVARQKVQAWHEDFWSKHNTAFVHEKKKFEQSFAANGSVSPDKMSVFYKSFLDKYWSKHLQYNIEWYKKNIKLLHLSIIVEINRFFKKFR